MHSGRSARFGVKEFALKLSRDASSVVFPLGTASIARACVNMENMTSDSERKTTAMGRRFAK